MFKARHKPQAGVIAHFVAAAVVYAAQFAFRMSHAELQNAIVCNLVAAPHADVEQTGHQVDSDGFHRAIAQVLDVADVEELDARAQVDLVQLLVPLGISFWLCDELPVRMSVGEVLAHGDNSIVRDRVTRPDLKTEQLSSEDSANHFNASIIDLLAVAQVKMGQLGARRDDLLNLGTGKLCHAAQVEHSELRVEVGAESKGLPEAVREQIVRANSN